jgi:phage terminase large subunit-like protein
MAGLTMTASVMDASNHSTEKCMSKVLESLKEYCIGMFDFKLTKYQAEFAHSCLTSKRVIAVFCRQSGKSETTAKIAIIKARLKDKANVLIFAPTDRQTGLMAEKIGLTIAKMPYHSEFHIDRQTQREFYFSNGSAIICETVGDSGETIRGYTADVIILEEAGSIKDSIVHSVILPMGATKDADIIKIGTPRGMNHFFESSKNSDYKIHRIGWKQAVEEGIVKVSYVEEMKANLPSDRFRTEMEAEFIADEDAYFGYDLIEKCVKPIPEESTAQPNAEYYLGADIARMGKDSTCFIIMKKTDEGNMVVKIVDIPKCTLDYVIDKINQLHNSFNFSRIFIDETGLGAGVRDVLARSHNPARALPPGRYGLSKIYDVIVGVKFTVQSKIDIYSNLKVLMEQGKLSYPHNSKLISQLRDFRYELTANDNVKLHHSEYGFDDYCDALALAAQGDKDAGFVMDFV